jgi:hypothetical protein
MCLPAAPGCLDSSRFFDNVACTGGTCRYAHTTVCTKRCQWYTCTYTCTYRGTRVRTTMVDWACNLASTTQVLGYGHSDICTHVPPLRTFFDPKTESTQTVHRRVRMCKVAGPLIECTVRVPPRRRLPDPGALHGTVTPTTRSGG